MRGLSLLSIAVVALPLVWCQEGFDPVAALADLGLLEKDFGSGQRATLQALIEHAASNLTLRRDVLGCKYSVRLSEISQPDFSALPHQNQYLVSS